MKRIPFSRDRARQPALDLGLPGLPAAAAPPPPCRAAAEPPPLRVAPTGPAPFHYTDAMWGVARDIVAALEELRHVDLERVLLSLAQARGRTSHGTYAACFPLRFQGGARETVIRGRRYRMPLVRYQGREMLYILYFMLPRFHQEQTYHDKLATVIHELYHISPRFDGDIRRFPGRYFAHGGSRDHYHAAMRKLADRYLAESPRASEHEFLHAPFQELLRSPGGVVGMRVARPAPVLLPEGGSGRPRGRGG